MLFGVNPNTLAVFHGSFSNVICGKVCDSPGLLAHINGHKEYMLDAVDVSVLLKIDDHNQMFVRQIMCYITFIFSATIYFPVRMKPITALTRLITIVWPLLNWHRSCITEHQNENCLLDLSWTRPTPNEFNSIQYLLLDLFRSLVGMNVNVVSFLFLKTYFYALVIPSSKHQFPNCSLVLFHNSPANGS